MNCPNCGAQLPDGATFCTACGTPIQQAAPDMYAQPENAYAQPAYEAAQPAAPKSKKGLIGGIIAGVVVLAAILVVLFVFVLGGGKLDGKYVCKDFAAFGMDMYIEIDGDKFTMVSAYEDEKESEEGTVKVDGDKISLTVDGETLDAKYDKKEKTITISESGISLTFTKE